MADSAQSVVLAVLVVATSIWLGGYVAIAVVARAARVTLDAERRGAFFAALGRSYVWVGTPALLVAYAAGVILAHDRLGTGLFVAAVVLAVVLVVCLAVAIGQARRMGRLRRALLAADSEELRDRVQRGARSATALRASLGLLSLALVVVGAFLAV